MVFKRGKDELPPKSYNQTGRSGKTSDGEAVGVILIIVSAFLLLCVSTKSLILGDIGLAVSGIILGLFGLSAYAVLVFLFVLGIVKLKKLKSKLAISSSLAIAVAALAFLALLHLIAMPPVSGESYINYMSRVYENKLSVGGVFFGSVIYALSLFATTVFAYIILSIIIAVTLMFLGRKLIFSKIGSGRGDAFTRTVKRERNHTRTSPTEDKYSVTKEGGLFIGSIIPQKKYKSDGGRFDTLHSKKDNSFRTFSTKQEKEEAYNEYIGRDKARKILFDENTEAYEKFLPKKAEAEPVIKKEDNIPSVPFPAPKNISGLSGGPIINGDALSESIKGDMLIDEYLQKQKEAEVKMSEIEAVQPEDSDTSDISAPVKKNFDYSKLPPIINGDLYVPGGEAPKSQLNKYDGYYVEVNGQEDGDVSGPVYSDGEYKFVMPKSSPVQEPKILNVDSIKKDNFSEPHKPENSAEYSAQNGEETDSAYFSVEETEGEAGNADFSEKGIGENKMADEDNSGEVPQFDFSVSPQKEEENIPDEVNEDDESYSDGEETASQIYGKENANLDNEVQPEAASAYEDGAFDSDNTENSGESKAGGYFKFEDGGDLSQYRVEDGKDNTGYYTVKEDVSLPRLNRDKDFDERVDDIDRKINGQKPPVFDIKTGQFDVKTGQIDIDAYTKAGAVKAEQKAKEHKKIKRHIYVAPPIDLLKCTSTPLEFNDNESQEKVELLENTLEGLGIPAKVNAITKGPAVTRYELDVPPGISVKRFESLAQDIRYNLASKGQVRIESPIPGKRAVGVEVPNEKIAIVALRDIIASPEFKASPSPLTVALGKDIQGRIMLTRLEKMPHLLIAGATGSGKSACLNSLIISILYKSSPTDVKLILVDPKRVEFTGYNGLPHMMIKNAITEVSQAINAFKWARAEMERRYKLLQEYGVRNIQEFNSSTFVKEGVEQKIPYIVVIVDELADLMISSANDKHTLEDIIMSIAGKARAAGIHLVLATQRPSVDVITGTIKANLPSRIAFAVSSSQNSRIILDNTGAESLLGRGDMLYAPLDQNEETRIQGAYVDNDEVKSIVDFIKDNNPSDFDEAFESALVEDEKENELGYGSENNPYDKELIDVVRSVIRSGSASSSMIQRRFRFGWNKAARIMEQMEELGFIGAQNGSKPREVYITKEKFEEFFGEEYEQQ